MMDSGVDPVPPPPAPEPQTQEGSTTTVEFYTDFMSSRRFPFWIALTALSVICLVAQTASLVGTRSSPGKYVTAVAVLSMLLGCGGVAGYMLIRDKFSGKIPEMVVVGVLTILWGTGLPVAMNPEHAIAVRPGPEIHDATLYVATWACFLIVLYMASTLFKDSLDFIDLSQVSTQVVRWYCLAAGGMVVAGSSTRILRTTDCRGDGATLNYFFTEIYCKRTKLAIAIGVITFVISFFMAFALALKIPLPANAEKAVSSTIFILWCFGIGFLTFGDEYTSPASTISNLYFASWACFVLTVFLFSHAFVAGAQDKDGTDAQQQQQQAGQEGSAAQPSVVTPELPVEEDF